MNNKNSTPSSRLEYLIEQLREAPPSIVPALTRAIELELERAERLEESRILGASNIVGKISSPEQAYAIWRTIGEPRGMTVAEALAGTHLMHGRISEAAGLVWADIQRELGGRLVIEENSSGMAAIINRGESVQIVSYTYEEARQAELDRGNKNWGKFPADMVFARLGTRVANRLGIRPRSTVYTREETISFGSASQERQLLEEYIQGSQLVLEESPVEESPVEEAPVEESARGYDADNLRKDLNWLNIPWETASGWLRGRDISLLYSSSDKLIELRVRYFEDKSSPFFADHHELL